jgi:2-(1,2-epoxy-1,2-dihydrophenyl)acetyl-CoA isomerase
MESAAVLYEKKGNVAFVTLNRPDVFNAFNDDQSYQLQDALKQANKDEDVRVVVLAGASLALACDFIIAAEHASLIEVFVNVGLVPDSGSSYFLPKSISPARAFEMCTMAQKVTALQALEWGLINRVVAAEGLDEEVAKVADFYANAPTLAIGMIKKMLNKATHSDLDTMLQYEAYCQEIAGRSDDYREGVTAFNEKRKPEFKGK